MSDNLDAIWKAWNSEFRYGVIPVFSEECLDDDEITALASKESKLPPLMPDNAEVIDLDIHELNTAKQDTLRSFIRKLLVLAKQSRDEHQRD